MFDLFFFLNSANRICKSTDISKYFRESLGLRDNESTVSTEKGYDKAALLWTDWEFRKKCHEVVTVQNASIHYENNSIQIYRKFHLQKLKNIQIKNSDIFHISAQNIDCGHSLEPPRRGGSNEYPQSMFLSRNKKNNVYPVNPSFTI